VLNLLEVYAKEVHFLTTELAYDEIHAHVPAILRRRGVPTVEIDRLLSTEILPRIHLLVPPIPQESYADLEQEARRRLRGRDEADWPFLALALRLECPIWTEDTDFFGSGVSTWTTDRIEIFLRSRS
jgi:predicted nucleic acid-binding protein